jgi:hypothetical protein
VSAPGSLLVVGVSYTSFDVGNVTTVKYAGTPLQKLASFEQSDSVTAELWYLVRPSVGSNSLSVTFNTTPRTGVAGAITWTGADLAAPFATPVKLGGLSATPTVFAPSIAGQTIQDVLAWTGATATVGLNQTQAWNLVSGNARGSGSTKPAGTLTTTKMSWTLSQSVNWAQVAVSIKRDVTPPFVAVSSPTANTAIGGYVPLNAIADDNTAIGNVQFQIDGENVGSPDASAPYTTVLTSYGLTDGIHLLTAVATDTSGNKKTSQPVPVIVDNSAPVISNGQPAGYVPPGSTSVTLSINTSEVATCRYGTIRSAPYSSLTKTFSTTNGTYHTAVEPISAQGTYTYYARCQDVLGNNNQLDYTITFYMNTAFYASTTGSSTGAGTLNDPWDLQTAFDQPLVKPGDALYIRGGVYSRPLTLSTENYIFRSNLQGSTTAPVTVSPYAGERVIIDGHNPNPDTPWSALVIRGSDTWFYGLEVIDSQPYRFYPVPGYATNTGDGVTIHAPRTKVINFIVHDNTGDGFGLWSDSPGSEVYGSLVFNNGFWQNDGAGNASWYGGWMHGMYAQNQGATTSINNSLFFHNFGLGIAPHGTPSSYLDNLNIEGNVSFENGSLTMNPQGPGGGNLNYGRNFWWNNCCPMTNVAQNPRIVDNHFYYTDQQENVNRGSMFILSDTSNAIITGNYLMRGAGVVQGNHTNLDFSGNTVLGPMTPALPGNTYLSANPANNAVFLKPNQYDPKRANVIVYNWLLSPTVAIDVSSLGWQIGATYELRNVQDYFNDVIYGTYSGLPIVVPMLSRSTAAPTNWSTPVSTFPEFGTFVLIRH